MTAIKEQAVELINRLSDDKVADIIRYVQGLVQKQDGDGTPKRKTPVLGCAKGRFKMADDFDAPLDDFKEYM